MRTTQYMHLLSSKIHQDGIDYNGIEFPMHAGTWGMMTNNPVTG